MDVANQAPTKLKSIFPLLPGSGTSSAAVEKDVWLSLRNDSVSKRIAIFGRKIAGFVIRRIKFPSAIRDPHGHSICLVSTRLVCRHTVLFNTPINSLRHPVSETGPGLGSEFRFHSMFCSGQGRP